MKFQPDTLDGVNVITRQDSGPPPVVWIGNTAFNSSVLVPWVGDVQAWEPAVPGDLRSGHFERILAFKPEIVIFGSGARLQFVAPALLRTLIDARIGVETMDTPAACRTYNVLAAEKRKVLAALLIAGAPPGAGSAEVL
jgi:uncharacterized protein